MENYKRSRRAFLKTNAVVGAGAIMGINAISPPAQAGFYIPNDTPALLGGKPVHTNGWPSWPKWDPDKDEKLVLEVLRSGIWSRAKVVEEFEEKWATTIGSKRCLTVVNGTNALIAAMVQADIGAGDEVMVSSYTFIASIAAILQTGAIPVFVDSDPATFQIDPAKIKEKLTPKTRAILPVHILGLPADMESIMAIAANHNLVVIEDACQSWLAEINHKQTGTFGLAGCFSFQNSKNIPMGEGGAIVSDDDDFIDRCTSYHSYGYPSGAMVGTVSTGAVIAGTKLRLTEYQAAIGLAQLSRLEGETVTRSENAAYLASKIKEIPGIIPYQLYPNVTRAVFHLFPFRYHKNYFNGLPRAVFLKALNAEGVPCSSGYLPLNDKPYLKHAFESKNYKKMYPKEDLDFNKYVEQNQCPETDKLCYDEGIWLPQNLLLGKKEDMDLIALAIEKIQKNAEKLLNHG